MSDFSGFAAICASLAAPSAGPTSPRTVIELLTADIRQHLTPVLTTRPATNQRNTLRFNAAGMHDIHAICQRITHAFQHCSRQFIGAMLMSQTKENPFAWDYCVVYARRKDKAETKLARHFHQPVELQRLKLGHCSGRLISRPNPDTTLHSALQTLNANAAVAHGKSCVQRFLACLRTLR